MKKICFFSGDITRGGGTERISILLANKLVQKDYEVCFISIAESNSELNFFLDSKIKHYALFRRNVSLKCFLLLAIIKLHQFIKKNNIDVVIDIDIILSFISIFAVWGTKCQQVSWEHFHFYENLGVKIRDFARKLAKKYASAIVVLTQTDKKQYLENGAIVPVICIPNAVILPDELPRKKFNTKVILSVGRLEYQKGFERIPALAERIFNDFPDWKWIIVGDGSLKKLLSDEIVKRNLQDKLFLVGKQNPFEYYWQADFLVSVSRYEGMPLVLLEALNCECPVISFNCKHGPADIIKDSENGYLVEAENFTILEKSIRSLINAEDLCNKLSENAKESVADFSVENFVKKWIQVIELF